MTLYRPVVDALQWTGTNVTEFRQFVRGRGRIDNAIIRDGVLYLTFKSTLAVTADLVIEPTDWVIFRGNIFLEVLGNDEFVLQYVLETP